MSKRAVWTAGFLALTVAAVAMELVAGIFWPGSDRPAWTDLIVANVPASITTAAVGVLVAWLPGHFIDAYRRAQASTITPVPSTQARYPWRATLRTAAAWLVGASPMLAEYLAGLHPGGPAVVGQTLAVGLAVTRFLARPDVERWLHVYLPWLAPVPPAPPG